MGHTLTENHTDFTFFTEQKHKVINAEPKIENMEHTDKGHRQHKHDEETDIRCHCSAKETKRS